jgi:hypothetical protein
MVVDDGPEIGVVAVLYPPAPPPPNTAPPDPPPATTTYSTVSLKVPGAVKVPVDVNV